ncbi:alanine--tRNA ligase [Mycobacteroides abscessus subsp. massiliense]|nr:alanine--tRNA ligase [Mycobacteroides abscessus subsp. massiliense]
MAALSSSLKVPSEEVPGRVATLVERLKVAEKELEQTRLASVKASIATLVDNAERMGSVTVVAHRLPDGTGAGDLRSLVGDIRGRLGSDPAVVALIAAGEGSVPFVVSVNQAAQDAGLRANDLVGAIGPAVDGRGGGKADTAQGSGKDPAGIDAALQALRAQIRRA